MTITSHIYLWSPEVTRRHHSCAFHCFLGHHLVNLGELRTKEVGMRELIQQLGLHKEKEPLDLCATRGVVGGTNILSRNELGIS
jgi:hypothetical protein